MFSLSYLFLGPVPWEREIIKRPLTAPALGIGTKSLLGLSERRGSMNEDYYVPKELLEQLSFGKAMYADFTICPLTDDEPGVMRLVCVESAENISIRDWP